LFGNRFKKTAAGHAGGGFFMETRAIETMRADDIRPYDGDGWRTQINPKAPSRQFSIPTP